MIKVLDKCSPSYSLERCFCPSFLVEFFNKTLLMPWIVATHALVEVPTTYRGILEISEDDPS